MLKYSFNRKSSEQESAQRAGKIATLDGKTYLSSDIRIGQPSGYASSRWSALKLLYKSSDFISTPWAQGFDSTRLKYTESKTI